MRKENRDSVHKDIQQLFVTYKLAFDLQHPDTNELKYSAFDRECVAFWNHYRELHMNHTYDMFARHLKAPTYQQVTDWLREKHKIFIYIKKDWHNGKCLGFESVIEEKNGYTDFGTFKTYYKALDKAIEGALKII